jgi:hypothetical protein
MDVTVTRLSDGGRVESWLEGATLHLQKYDAAGAAVGEAIEAQAQNFTPEVVALDNGGFAFTAGYVFRGGIYTVEVYDARAERVASLDAPGTGIGIDIAASPLGGFLVASMESQLTPSGFDYGFAPLVTLYGDDGTVARPTRALSGELPAVGVNADGGYQLSWQDGRAMEIDSAPAASAASLRGEASGSDATAGLHEAWNLGDLQLATARVGAGDWLFQ